MSKSAGSSIGETIGTLVVCFSAGYLLGGDWQHGLGAILVQMIVVQHLTTMTKNLTTLATFLKK